MSAAIAAVMSAFLMTYPRDRIKAILIIFVFARVTFIPAAGLIGFGSSRSSLIWDR